MSLLTYDETLERDGGIVVVMGGTADQVTGWFGPFEFDCTIACARANSFRSSMRPPPLSSAAILRNRNRASNRCCLAPSAKKPCLLDPSSPELSQAFFHAKQHQNVGVLHLPVFGMKLSRAMWRCVDMFVFANPDERERHLQVREALGRILPVQYASTCPLLHLPKRNAFVALGGIYSNVAHYAIRRPMDPPPVAPVHAHLSPTEMALLRPSLPPPPQTQPPRPTTIQSIFTPRPIHSINPPPPEKQRPVESYPIDTHPLALERTSSLIAEEITHCPISMEPISPSDTDIVKCKTCVGVFKKRWLLLWLNTSKSCPMCRQPWTAR